MNKHGMNHEGREGHEALEALATAVVDAGLTVHRALGPGLLESAYGHCLMHELLTRGISAQQQIPLPITYKDITLDAGYRLDLVVQSAIIVEIKAVEDLSPVHFAQVLTYMKLSGLKVAFLMNFNVALFKHGLRRLVL